MFDIKTLALLKHGKVWGAKNIVESALLNKWGGGASYEKTVGPAPIISISDAKAKPAKSLIVGMEPVQDLHGYDNPWPAGGGVNKIDVNQLQSYGTAYGLTASFDGDWIVLSGEYKNSGQAANFRIATLKDGSAFPVTKFKAFPDSNSSSHMPSSAFGLADSNKTLTIYITNMVMGETYNLRCKIVGYEGDTAPDSWSPYSNECPITGRTEANIYRYAEYDADAQPTYTIQLGQTVYGGTVDLVSGLLTVTHGMVDLGTLSWTKNTVNNVFYASFSGNANKSPSDKGYRYISSVFVFGSIVNQLWNSSADGLCVEPTGISNTPRIYARNVAYYDLDAMQFQTAMSGVQLCYELATPITYQLTPQQIQLLRGSNVLWSDGDSLTLTYLGTTPPNLLGGMLGLGGAQEPTEETSEESVEEPASEEQESPPDEQETEETEEP